MDYDYEIISKKISPTESIFYHIYSGITSYWPRRCMVTGKLLFFTKAVRVTKYVETLLVTGHIRYVSLSFWISAKAKTLLILKHGNEWYAQEP